jgi:hypothetical protein
MLPQVQLREAPRMADFAQWGEAVSLGLGWPAATFLSQYLANRHDACAVALEDFPVVEALQAILALYRQEGYRAGTPAQILHELCYLLPENGAKPAQWPKNARSLSCQLRRIAPQLRTIGIDVQFDRRRTGRVIRISAI